MLILLLPLVFAEEDPSEQEADGSIIVEDTKDDADQIGSISQIDVDLALKQADLGELLSQLPSITIRRFGGLGAYSALSVRGGSADQTTIMINGIPLNPEGSSAINLSELPLSAFSTIELYRSHVPLEFQSSSIGGVVNLIPNTEKQKSISLGTGSFQTLAGETSVRNSLKKHDFYFFARHFQTQGNFEYFDDNATIYNLEDDSYQRRQNNSKHQQNIFFFDSWKNLSLLHNTHFQNGGVGGSIIMPFENVSLSTSRHLSSLLWKDVFPLFSHQISGWHILDTSQLEDLSAEVFGGQQSQQQNIHQLGLRGHHQFFYSESFIPSLSWGSRWEYNQNQNLLTDKTELEHQRFLSQLQLGMQFFTESQLEEHTAIQLYHFHSNEKDQFFVAPKTSFLFRFSENILFWSSANRSFRPPTMMELYGNQASVIGNPQLIPETSITVDGGFVWKGKEEHISLQTAYFHRWNQDNIILVQNAQNQSIPLNFAKTKIQGLENALSFKPNEKLFWNISFTWNHSLNLSEIESLSQNQLPNIPAWNFEHQLGLKHQFFSFQHRWSFIDQNYSDSTNHYRYPTRSFHNIELGSIEKGYFPAVSLVIRNLTNTITEETELDPLQPDLGAREQAISDFIGYPLSGRHFFLTLTWNEKQP